MSDDIKNAKQNMTPGSGTPEDFSSKDKSMAELFEMVFQASQKAPNTDTTESQKNLTKILTRVLCSQVVWALVLIPLVIFLKPDMSASMSAFVTLLISAILAEVVAMAFVVVRFVFRTPLDTMSDLLKAIIDKQNRDT